MIIKNKKGGEKIMIVYWIFIWILVSVALVAGVLKGFGSNMDVRRAEVGLMKDRIVDCLVENGELNSKFNALKEDNLLETCKIDLRDNTQIYKDTEQYAVTIGLYGNANTLIKEVKYGNQALFVTCNNEEKTPKCITRLIYVLDNGKGKFLKISTGIGKAEKNVQ